MTAVITSTSPHNPDDIVGEVEQHSADAVLSRVAAARAASRTWGSVSALERSAALFAAATALNDEREDLIDLIVREVGKPLVEARGELDRAEAILRFYSQMCLGPSGEILPADRPGTTLMTRRRPHGTVGLITPWNFPVAIPIWKAAPALAAGNAVVLKPAPDACVTAAALGSILQRYLPESVLTIVNGEAEAGSALVESVDAVSFTGSNAVGMQVAAAATRRAIPVQTEMGGHNPTIVLPDADIERAAAQLAFSIAGFSGQKCTATRRVITIGPSVELVKALAAALDALPAGDPADPATRVGPLVSSAALERVDSAISNAVTNGGAHRVTRRRREDIDAPGPYAPPTLLTGARAGSEILTTEVFGPVAAVQEARDDDAAVQLANAVEFGLTAAVIGQDLGRAHAIVDRLHAGMVKVNEPTTGVSFQGPFGGAKASSFGPREQGREAFDMYTWKQTVTLTPEQ